MNRRSAPSGDPTSGFTILELVIVMGILSGFLIMLVQLVDGGLRMFGEGELGQALADRTSRAQRVITRELAALRGTPSGRDRDAVDDRLVVQLLPIGLPNRPERGATLVQVLRGAARLPPERELSLIDATLASRVLQENPTLSAAALEEQVQKQRHREPLRSVGNVLLVPWRQDGPDEALLELRGGWFLPGQLLPLSRDRMVDPFAVAVPGSPELPGLLVYQSTLPLLSDLLHVEFLLWSQTTRSWGGEAVATSPASSAAPSGPLRIWDSGRGGWLVDEASGGVFPFDRGPASFRDGSDDIHPHAIRVRCVVAQPGDTAPEGLLARELDDDGVSLTLMDGNRFPGPDTGGFVKIRGEWIRYGGRDGDNLTGLRRGQRTTKPLAHPAGTRVHVGRTVEFVVPVLHAKDDWNG